MKYYKGVRVRKDGKRVSAFVTNPVLVVEYKIGEWAEPKIDHKDHGIFVSNISNALNSVVSEVSVDPDTGTIYTNGGQSKYEIYECDVVLPETPMRPMAQCYEINLSNEFVPQSSNAHEFKDSTIIVSKCKLTRKLTGYELLNLEFAG